MVDWSILGTETTKYSNIESNVTPLPIRLKRSSLHKIHVVFLMFFGEHGILQTTHGGISACAIPEVKTPRWHSFFLGRGRQGARRPLTRGFQLLIT